MHRTSVRIFTRLGLLLFILWNAIGQPRSLPQKAMAIRCGRLIDGKSERVIEKATILVHGEKITAVGKEVQVPPDAAVIDLGNATVLPGLIDCHTHLLLHGGDYDTQLLKESVPLRTIYGTVHARQTLEAGFTMVRDLETEGAMYADVALRDAVNMGLIPGPRILAATRALSVTGGYQLLGYAPGVDVPSGAQLVDGVSECRKAVREQIKYGADWIKIYADSRRRTVTADSLVGFPTFSMDELKAIVEEANKMGVKVAAHAYTSAAARNAVVAGVASIEHGLYLDEATLKLMAEKGVYWCPTLIAYVHSSQRDIPSAQKAILQNTVQKHKQTFQRGLKSGVKIVLGSDLYDPHGCNALEFGLMVDYGMPPMQAIKAATSLAAELLGWQDRVGGIEVGKIADLIAVKENPLDNIRTLEQVTFVMKGGQVVRNATR